MDTPSSILIVEDESVVVLDLETNLTRLGYLVAGSAISGEEAIRKAGQMRPDLVLMDIQLYGEMDGLQTAEVIHQQFGIPVVFITANVDEQVIARSRQSGAYGFLNKPFRPSELEATLQIALHQHRASSKASAERDLLAEQVHTTFEALGQSREELQALSRHLMTVQEEERTRIARELHDDLGQQVALLGMQADLLQSSLQPEQDEMFRAVRSGLSRLGDALRDVSHRLHPPILADLGLADAMEALVADFRAQGLAIQASFGWTGEIPLRSSTAVYRIGQESLVNVLKHAPSARVRVALTRTGTDLSLRVSDDGQGFSLSEVREHGGLGLISMQERARLVGGNLLLTAKPGQGTTVLVRVPVKP